MLNLISLNTVAGIGEERERDRGWSDFGERERGGSELREKRKGSDC